MPVALPGLPVALAVALAFTLAFAGCEERRYPNTMVTPRDGQATDAGSDRVLPPDAPALPDAITLPDVPVVDPDAAVEPDASQPVDTAPVAFCGNGVLDPGEVCDDGNSRPGDGCSGICAVESNYSCPAPAQACIYLVVCGDGKITANEACDDGNVTGNDGCSVTCQVEGGFACSMPGKPCTAVVTSRCGDGVVNSGEGCDDSNAASGDGCSATCAREGGYLCATPGTPCTRDAFCGDGRLDANEQCDDKNTAPGDGCTGICAIEPFYTCPTPGAACASSIVCGDGKVVGDEACDDGNKVMGDGCAADCKRVEPGFTCPTASGMGGACTAVIQERCGDGRLSFGNGEFCDDGNTSAGDGCSDVCIIEAGYTCPQAGMTCVRTERCGDGRLAPSVGESCDDANTAAGDGCSAQCAREANYSCPTPGAACVSTVVCGDGRVTGGETCDDSNTAAGDGCSAVCAPEAGWTCPSGGVCRATSCGDGLLVGSEKCDDGNATAGDGCSTACVVESPGPTEPNAWSCPTPNAPCVRTTCGNGIPEGSEQCDDGDNDLGDGCTPFCRAEPTCPPEGGACATGCGDGLILPIDVAQGQECDDGNTVSGDGCSAACKQEVGYACTATPFTQDPLILPVILRDFNAFDTPTTGHPDFEQYNVSNPGLVQTMLGASGKPVHVTTNQPSTANTYAANALTGTDWFGMWYADNATYNRTVRDVLTFTTLPGGVFQYNNSSFFLLDGSGFNVNTGAHNFHFTSEVRYWFEFQGNESFDFTGDDDVWVFVNKRLAVDLGGQHAARTGNIQFMADGSGQVCDLVTPDCDARRSVAFGMQVGSVYEIVVFQAERHTTASNYRLTLGNFRGTRSVCSSVCGDANVTAGEACDLGTAKNTGAYGTCNADCTLPPRCGDGVTNGAEQCDDGVNQTPYGGTAQACAPGCVRSGFCGDGAIDSAHGEECDQAADNGKGYGFCTSACKQGPRCGDGVASNGEECDEGVATNGTPNSACMATCKKKCGNGGADPGEECDDGTAANIGGYGRCSMMCKLGPRCGDGAKNGTEECDDGKNDGSYGACAPMCKLGPRCGDSVVQAAAGEVCDQGAMNSAMAYGMSKCDGRCKPAPFCGDKRVDATFMEKCDDGVNSGQPGSCKTDCSDFVPNPSCGDGITQTNEQCDAGPANGTIGNTCDTHCRFKCGNGSRDPGEECDDGVNSGAYGTCNANCTLAGYCGDGAVNGTEQCDRGTLNEAAPYGPDKCTTMCTTAPRCGDGRIESTFGEVCDSTPLCDMTCQRETID